MNLLTTQKWHDRAEFNMSQAQRTQDMAHGQCDASRTTHAVAVADNHDMYEEVNSNLEEKVNTSRRLVTTLQQRARCLEDSIQKTRQSLAQLEAARRAKDPPLQLCHWRMEQRAKRPVREQVRDAAEIALEEEKTTLVSLQWDLGDAMEHTKAVIHELETRLAEVRHDIDHKVHSLGIDEMCLATAQSSFAAASNRTPRMPAPLGGPLGTMRCTDRYAHLESGNNEDMRMRRTGNVDNLAASREDTAAILREENARLAGRCEQAAREAKYNTDRKTQERVNENREMKTRLEDEIRETDGKIDYTNSTISETRFHMGALQEPLAMAASCNQWRRDRTAREHISDPVSTSLSEHHNTVLRAHEELSGHHEAEKASLQQLFARRQQLVDDLRDKTASHEIDSRCLSHGAAPRAGRTGTRDFEASKLAPQPTHGTSIPGRAGVVNGHGATVQLGAIVTSSGGHMQPVGTLPSLGASAVQLAATMPSQGGGATMQPTYLSSWKLAGSRTGGTMTPRTLGSPGVLPQTARLAMTH